MPSNIYLLSTKVIKLNDNMAITTADSCIAFLDLASKKVQLGIPVDNYF